MKILILAIDRDNDFGVKANVKGPVVGRDRCLEAAVKLSLADPEDSDANTLFAAIKLYDELKESGKFEGIEVALITGHHNVGVESDLELSRQLDEVLAKFPADGVIPVTDGAEDEQIFPIISSKVPIVSTRRVVVKQSPGIETTWYIIVRYIKELMSDPEISKVILGIPGLIVLLYGIAKIVSLKYPASTQIVSSTVTGVIMLIVGGYFFSKGFKIQPIASLVRIVSRGLITFIGVVTGFIVILGGAINVYITLESIAEKMIGGIPTSELIAILIYLNAVNKYFILGLGIMIAGKIIQEYLRRNPHLWYYIAAFLLLPAFWKVIDLITLYSNPLVRRGAEAYIGGILLVLLDLGISIMVSIKLREKMRRWATSSS
ncbi:hypothetical protein PNA2_0904 [Pyrococcus sp. NA2]|uniref:DUF373 family protein n=1 Tax=Pyrococcus sp. (strain NA2) TaxID=342949 RepID=UPI000209B051|nr:DUF373 family protein [Pyrococcus sp. NA2]AEC51819.1 hypothetical protein PNA2_0904 [Pyrococcus sp. NA2]